MTTAATSRSSYMDHVLSGKATTQREQILRCLRDSAVPLNRRQIKKLTGLEINAVAGRVNTLLKSGLVRVIYADKDPVTGRRVEYLEAAQRAFRMNEQGQWGFEIR